MSTSRPLRRLDPSLLWAGLGVAGQPIAGLIIAMVIVRGSSHEAYGLYSVGMTLIVTAAVIAGFGAPQRSIPWIGGRELGTDKRRELADLGLGLAGLGLLVGVLLSGMLAALRAGGLWEAVPRSVYGAIALGIAGQSVLALASNERRGRGRIRHATILGPAAVTTTSSLVILATIVAGLTLTGVSALTITAMTIVGFAIPVSVAPVAKLHWRPSITRAFRTVRSWVRPSRPYAAWSIITSIDDSVSLWVVATAASSVIIGQYALAFKLATVFAMPLAATTFALVREFAREAAEPTGGERLLSILTVPLRIAASISMLGLVITLAWGDRLIGAAFGIDGTEVAHLVLVVAIGFFVSTITGPSATMLQYVGREDLALKSALAGLVATTLGCIVGFAVLGAVGVAAGTSIGRLTRTLLAAKYLHRETGWSFAQVFLGGQARA